MTHADTGLRPGEFARHLLQALSSTEGRRRKRKRNTTPDLIGLEIKTDILRAMAETDPAPTQIEEWLLSYCLSVGKGDGGVRAMALSVLDEWQVAQYSPGFLEWLHEGAPSEDAVS